MLGHQAVHCSHRRPALLVAVALAFVYLYAFPYFERLYNANELPRIALAESILDHGTFAIGDEAHPPQQVTDTAIYAGHYYSNKAPGLSFLGVPVLAAQRLAHRVLGRAPPSLRAETYVLRVFCVTLPALAFLLVIWRLTGLYTDDERARLTVVAGYAVGTLALPVSLLYMSHQPAAALVGTSFLLFTGTPRAWHVALGGFLAGAAILFDYQSAFFLVPIGIYALIRVRPVWRIALAAAGAVPPILALLAYHKACFGAIGRTGYEFATVPQFRAIHHTGFLGLSRPSFTSFYVSFLSPDNGMFALSPWLFLGLAGWGVAWWRRRSRGETAVAAAVGLTAVAFLTCLLFARGGWQLGPRYIAVAVPFFAAPAAAALAALPEGWRAPATGLVLGSALLHATAALLFPTWPEKLWNPVVELVWPLLQSGHAPYSLGSLLHLPGRVAMALPAVAAVVAVLAAARPRRAWSAVVLVVAAGFLLQFARYDRTPGTEATRIRTWVESIWEP